MLSRLCRLICGKAPPYRRKLQLDSRGCASRTNPRHSLGQP